MKETIQMELYRQATRSLKRNEVDETNDATKSRQNNQNENKKNFYWNGVASTQVVHELNKANEKIVY